MQATALPELDPASLPVGAQVGLWRVKGWAGRGSYGAVYRAVRVDCEEAGEVALKFAVHPEDPRYEREVKLLARLHHPNVPRYLAHGHLQRPSGAVHPYLAMQWIQGVSLYAWAAQRNPSSRQVLQVLAQIARALEAVHAVQAVHRDVKGDNVLVRCGDAHVFLTDFGSANYKGASTLTPQAWPPGTPAYHSPEVRRLVQRVGPGASVRYMATPADDLFALGVTAYRLVTDEYPSSTEPSPAALNSRVTPRLNALILQMLAARPEARGTAEELADKLEEAAEQVDPELDLPLFAWGQLPPTAWGLEPLSFMMGPPSHPRRRDRQVARLARLRDAAERVELEQQEVRQRARAAARTEPTPARALASPRRLPFIVLAVCALVLMVRRQMESRSVAQHQVLTAKEDHPGARKSEAEKVGLGDNSPPAAEASAPEASAQGIRMDPPPKPFKGQRRPPCGKGEVEIHGGCWGELKVRSPDCLYEWKGGCYMPIILPPPPANSEQP